MKKITAIEASKFILMTLRKKYKPIGFFENISLLKLFSLLYYVQSYHLAMFNKPLFYDKIEIWNNSIVVPNVNDWFVNEIKTVNFLNTQKTDKSILSKKQKRLIKDVLSIYNKYSAYGLIEKIKMEQPWLETYEVDKKTVISKNKLKRFFIQYV